MLTAGSSCLERNESFDRALLETERFVSLAAEARLPLTVLEISERVRLSAFSASMYEHSEDKISFTTCPLFSSCRSLMLATHSVTSFAALSMERRFARSVLSVDSVADAMTVPRRLSRWNR